MSGGRHSGRIIHVDAARGFGFVQPDRDGPDAAVFLHVSRYAGTWPPAEGQSVTYTLAAGRRGLRADDCTPSP